MVDDRSPQRPQHPPQQRIAKLLARAGVASRREIERMIAEGRVAHDGVVLDTPATLLASLDGVTVDGQPVDAPAPARLFLFHKPAGVLTTERDFSGRPTIYDRLPKDLPRVVPVGRLDLNTEGLLLLTTDGGFKRELELPATGVERSYRARAYGAVTQAQLEELIHGVEVEGVRYGAIDANLERRTGANVWIELTLREGKNREVRRVLEHLGLRVGRLIRTRYGPFVLGDLPVGGIGEVRAADLGSFRHTLKSPAATRLPVEDVRVTDQRGTARSSPGRPSIGGGDRPARLRGAPAAAARGALMPHGAADGAAARRPEPSSRNREGAIARTASRGAPADRGAASPVPPGTSRPARGAAQGAQGGRSASSRVNNGPVDRTPGSRPERRPRDETAARPSRPPRGAADDRGERVLRSRGSGAGSARGARDGGDGPDTTPPTRPVRPKRQPGWAKAKPRSGPTKRGRS